MDNLQITITTVGLLFAAGTMLGTLLYARATTHLANATSKQASVSHEMAKLALEEAKIKNEERIERRRQRIVYLNQQLHELWLLGTFMDNEVRNRDTEPDLSKIPQVIELKNKFLTFMESHGSEVASYLDIYTNEWSGLRYLEDMIRWVPGVPKEFSGQDEFYKKHQSVNQMISQVQGSLNAKINS